MKNTCDNILLEGGTFRVICHSCAFPPKKYPLHWHNNSEICRVEAGRCVFRVGDGEYSAGQGDLIVIEKEALHQFLVPEEPEADGRQAPPAVIRILQFAYPLLLDGATAPGPLQTFIPSEKIAACPGLPGKIGVLFDLLESETSIGQNEATPYAKHLVSALYHLLLDAFPAGMHNGIDAGKKDFFLALSYIKEHFREDLKVGTIAEKLGIPRGRLAESFESFAGIALSEYIRIERVNYVNYLLSEGYAVSDAAMESGFQNLRTFNTVYRRLIGCTPSEYLRKKRQKARD